MRIIFYQPNNRTGTKDGNYFKLLAGFCKAFWTGQGHHVRMFPLPKGNDFTRSNYVLDVLRELPNRSADRFAFFGHGTTTWCDLGFSTKSQARFANLITELCAVLLPDSRIGLYCCLTAKNTTAGFARQLSDKTGCLVMGHTTSGRSTENPNKLTFKDGIVFHLQPDSQPFRKEYLSRLKTDKNYPFILLEEAQ
jgi:hypothetical protein